MDNLESFRQEYTKGRLLESEVPADPFHLFKDWMKDAIHDKELEPNAMVLSTVDGGGNPSSRVVLLKETTKEGFVFYTNYKSDKSKDMEMNKNISLLFVWLNLHRQVRINGTVEKLSSEKSKDYFSKRPRGSQLGAWASPQSQVVPNREFLEEKLNEAINHFESKENIDKPPHWGGYIAKPISIEFWQGRDNRLHDRLLYTQSENMDWKIERLAP